MSYFILITSTKQKHLQEEVLEVEDLAVAVAVGADLEAEVAVGEEEEALVAEVVAVGADLEAEAVAVEVVAEEEDFVEAVEEVFFYL